MTVTGREENRCRSATTRTPKASRSSEIGYRSPMFAFESSFSVGKICRQAPISPVKVVRPWTSDDVIVRVGLVWDFFAVSSSLGITSRARRNGGTTLSKIIISCPSVFEDLGSHDARICDESIDGPEIPTILGTLRSRQAHQLVHLLVAGLTTSLHHLHNFFVRT